MPTCISTWMSIAIYPHIFLFIHSSSNCGKPCMCSLFSILYLRYFFLFILYHSRRCPASSYPCCVYCVSACDSFSFYIFSHRLLFPLMLQFSLTVPVGAVSWSQAQYLKSDKTYFLTIWCSLMVPWLLLCLSLCPGHSKADPLVPITPSQRTDVNQQQDAAALLDVTFSNTRQGAL